MQDTYGGYNQTPMLGSWTLQMAQQLYSMLLKTPAETFPMSATLFTFLFPRSQQDLHSQGLVGCLCFPRIWNIQMFIDLGNWEQF